MSKKLSICPQKGEILTESMENPHFLCVRLGDMQNHLVLGKDSAGTLSPQQHERHVLKVYSRGKGGERGHGEKRRRCCKWENTLARPSGSPHAADDAIPAVVRMSTCPLSVPTTPGLSRSQLTSSTAPCPSGPHVHLAWKRSTQRECEQDLPHLSLLLAQGKPQRHRHAWRTTHNMQSKLVRRQEQCFQATKFPNLSLSQGQQRLFQTDLIF